MRNALTVRLPQDLARWLSDLSRQTGVPQGGIVRAQLEKARTEGEKPFLKLLGSIEGSPNLSRRKGFSRK